MPEPKISELIGEDGKFTPAFTAWLPTVLGEEHKDTKMFENTPDLVSMVKSSADTKSALGKKLEGVIQKPGENATDAEKVEYQTVLLQELGAPETADYGLTKPEDWPEAVPFDEELMTDFQNYFFEKKWPVGMVQELMAKYNGICLERLKQYAEAQETAHQEAVRDFKQRHKGDALTKKMRIAAKATLQFATDERIKLIQEAKLLETPADFDKWRSLGFSPEQIEVWANIGEKMKSDAAISDEGSGIGESTGKKTALSKMYDHPTSHVMVEAST